MAVHIGGQNGHLPAPVTHLNGRPIVTDVCLCMLFFVRPIPPSASPAGRKAHGARGMYKRTTTLRGLGGASRVTWHGALTLRLSVSMCFEARARHEPRQAISLHALGRSSEDAMAA